MMRSEQIAFTPQIPDPLIAERAYHIWQAKGCPVSDGSEDWQLATEQLLAEQRPQSRSPLHWLISRLRTRAA